MAKFTIQKDSVQVLSENKISMMVMFSAADGRKTEYHYHEVESTDKDFIEQELQKSANCFEETTVPAELPKVADLELTTGKAMSVNLPEDNA